MTVNDHRSRYFSVQAILFVAALNVVICTQVDTTLWYIAGATTNAVITVLARMLFKYGIQSYLWFGFLSGFPLWTAVLLDASGFSDVLSGAVVTAAIVPLFVGFFKIYSSDDGSEPS